VTSACKFSSGVDYLATVNLSAAPQWTYVLKTLPRPTGRGTRVIITEYDLPRETIEPHDVIVDADGMVWYSSFGFGAIKEGRSRAQSPYGRAYQNLSKEGLTQRFIAAYRV